MPKEMGSVAQADRVTNLFVARTLPWTALFACCPAFRLEDKKWAKVAGYPNYSVSTDGDVSNDRAGHILTHTQDANGYAVVCLYIRGISHKKEYVHRLVARAFLVTPCPELLDLVIHHIDGDKTHPAAANLECVTHILAEARTISVRFLRLGA